MSKHVLVVQSNAVAGREDEYNRWYSDQHLGDVIKVPGILTAQRFKIATDGANAKWKYLAIYEVETDDLAKTMAALNSRAGTPDMVISDAMDMQSVSMAPWVAITDKMS